MCKNKKLARVINLSPTPPANAFLTKNQLKSEEQFFPLSVNFCSNCGQLQLSHVVSPKLLFRDYVYVSSTSPVFVNHFEEYAKDIMKRFGLNGNSLLIDIGSNDGILLKPLKRLGVKVLGVDPAIKIARTATNNGIPTLPHFLNTKVAKTIVKKYGFADVVCANNAFAHIHDLDEIIKAVKIMTHPEGVFVIEFPYLVDFMEKNLFDTIYHEHLSYLSLRPLSVILKNHNMELFDVKRVNSHGGSVRVYTNKIGSKHKVQKSVEQYMQNERRLGLNNVNIYLQFANKIEGNRKKMITLMKKIKRDGKTIVGYGAPAKGNTLLNYFKIGPNTLDYIVDDSEYKQNLYTPGTHILVSPPSRIFQTNPDYILILAWNFASSIMEKLSSYKRGGRSFIIPVPETRII